MFEIILVRTGSLLMGTILVFTFNALQSFAVA